MSKKDRINKFRPSKIVSLLLAAAGISLLLFAFWPKRKSTDDIPVQPYSEFLEKVENDEIERVKVGDRLILYQLKPPLPVLTEPDNFLDPPDPLAKNPFHATPIDPSKTSPTQGKVLATVPINDPDLPQRLQAKGIIYEAVPPAQNNWLVTLMAWVVPPLILVGAMQFFLFRNEGRGTLAHSKNKAKMYLEGEAEDITFADVAGAQEAKTELVEIVEFLKNPQRFSEIGARIPKGVLLVGPPGTGKTLLAKAIAGEAGVTFFSISASEFVELFVGTGAARVRDLFGQAKKQAPSIVFIDELDAIGKSRASSGPGSGSNDEREQTLNQLLTEMDGFNASESTVIVLGATNRPETLDRALLRPGRFDRQVLVDRPDSSGRLAILEIYAQKVKLDEAVDLDEIAVQTQGFAGADLANLVNEAALLAARNGREAVSQPDFKEAFERVIAGLEKKSRVLSDKEKTIVAYHEVGHAIVGAVMPGGGRVSKISIVPRGLSALGYTLKMPTEDRFLTSDREYREQIAMLLGGRAAEEIIFGSVTNGASDDLQRATNIAELMVTAFGMSKVLGPLAYDKRSQTNFLGNENGNIRRLVSEQTAVAIDKEVKQIVEESYQQSLAILQKNHDLLEEISQNLLKAEVIEGQELQKWLDQATLPKAISIAIESREKKESRT